jgi:guanine deaminase
VATDERFLRMAIDLAVRAVWQGDAPFGALVVLDGEVLGTGCNRVVTGRDPTAHAEVVAIRAAAQAHGSHDLSGSVVYSSCEPCPMCLTASFWSHADRVVYAATRRASAAAGFEDSQLYDELAAPPYDRLGPLRVERLPLREQQVPFTAWSDRLSS